MGNRSVRNLEARRERPWERLGCSVRTDIRIRFSRRWRGVANLRLEVWTALEKFCIEAIAQRHRIFADAGDAMRGVTSKHSRKALVSMYVQKHVRAARGDSCSTSQHLRRRRGIWRAPRTI